MQLADAFEANADIIASIESADNGKVRFCRTAFSFVLEVLIPKYVNLAGLLFRSRIRCV